MPDSLFIEFPPVSTEEWEAAARADLKGKSPGKILYRSEDLPAGLEAQSWPARPWQIWAEVSSVESAKRARACGVQGLVVPASCGLEWWDVLSGVHVHAKAELEGWASGLSGTIEQDFVSNNLPRFRRAAAISDSIPIHEQIAACRSNYSPKSLGVGERLGISDETVRTHPMAHALICFRDFMLPVGPLYFEEIAKFRALRRLMPVARLIARTSYWYATAYDPHVNLLRATTEAMAAIIGGCDALIVGPFTEARGIADELAERLALNTQLLLRDEAYFDRVADPAAGSYYLEALTDSLVKGAEVQAEAPVFVGVNRYPNPKEATPEAVTWDRAMSVLETLRARSEQASRTPVVRLILGSDEKMSRARASFAREFFTAGGFSVVESGDADLAVLCDADSNYPALRSAVDFKGPVIAAGPDFNRSSDQAAVIAHWQDRLGVL